MNENNENPEVMVWKDYWEMTCQIISYNMNGTTWIFAQSVQPYTAPL